MELEVLPNLTVIIISQYIHVSYHILHLKLPYVCANNIKARKNTSDFGKKTYFIIKGQ